MTASSWPAFSGRSTQLGVTALTAIANDASSAWCVSFFSEALRQRTDATAGAANTRCDTFVINEVLVDPSSSDDTRAFIELAGPGGAVVGGVKINDIEGLGATAGQTNAPEYVVPAGIRMPVDGILLIADADSGGTTTLVPNFVPGVDVLAIDVDFENSGGDAIQLSSPANVLLDVLGHESAGAVLTVATAANGLAMYETATALTTLSDTTLARSPLSDDTNNNRSDFHGDPSPTPGLPNDIVNVTLTTVTPSSGIANTGSLSVVLQGTDLGSGTVFAFGATNATGCSVSSPTRMTCTVSSTAAVGPVNVTATPHLSVGGSASILTNGFTWTSVLNETDTAPEADFANLQFPATQTLQSGNSVLVYGRIYEAGATEAPGVNPSIRVELGIGPAAATSFQGWNWVPATYNVQVGNDDEYQASLVAPTVAASTNFSYTMRFSFDGLNWTYADLNGAGANAGLTLEFGQLGVLTATP